MGGMEHLGEGPDREGLGEPRNPLEQYVPAGEEPDEEPFDHGVLPDDPSPDLGHHGGNGSGPHSGGHRVGD